ncbi:hypothetical protein PtB15_14B111 [Puccinia triticina]|nr:hypothetical protein PtB15_14B111 [Puccinia triticina]
MDPHDPAASLGLVLHWLSSTMDEVELQDIFAISRRAYAQSWTRGRKALSAVLKQLPSAKMYWPTGEESSPDKYYYRNILTFAPDGTIFGGYSMLPGDWDDGIGSITVDYFYRNLLGRTPAGYRLISDVGLPNTSKELRNRILAPIQGRSQLPDPPRVICRIRPFNEQVQSAQHVAKWSKHFILDSFERLRQPLRMDERELQAEIWQTAARLHKFRWRLAQTRRTQVIYQSVWNENWLPEVGLDQSAICEIEPPCRVRRYYHAQEWF